VAVAAAALAVAVAAAAVGRLASGPVPAAAPSVSAPAAAAAAPAGPLPADPVQAADHIRRAAIQAQLAKVLARGETGSDPAGEPAPGAPGATAPAGEDDPRLGPLLARLKENPEDVDALLSVGYVYVQNRAYEKAHGYYLHAAQVAPDNVEARTHLGTVAYFLGHLDEALHHYEQALALDPDYAPAYFEMGAALRFGRHDLEGAVKAWEHFLALAPDAAEAGRIRQLVAETRRMIAAGTAPAAPAPEPAPFDPATAPWPGQPGPDRSQGAPPAGTPGPKAG
jgi:tetratricopeptide (TPR) repeat protein